MRSCGSSRRDCPPKGAAGETLRKGEEKEEEEVEAWGQWRRGWRRETRMTMRDDDGDEGPGGEEKEDADYWREQQEKLEKERKAIMDDHSLVAEEKLKLLRAKEKKMG